MNKISSIPLCCQDRLEKHSDYSDDREHEFAVIYTSLNHEIQMNKNIELNKLTRRIGSSSAVRDGGGGSGTFRLRTSLN